MINEVTVITGASSGIGAGLAKHLGSKGHQLVLAARREKELKDVDEITSVVLKSVLYGMQAIIPHFQERGRGHLINVSSLLERVPLVSHRSIYSAAKSGVNVLTLERAHGPQSQVCRNSRLAGHAWNGRDRFLQSCQNAQLPRAGSQVGPMIVQSAEEVATQIAGLIDNPVAEFYTNPASAGLVSQYYQGVGKFEENMARRTTSS